MFLLLPVSVSSDWKSVSNTNSGLRLFHEKRCCLFSGKWINTLHKKKKAMAKRDGCRSLIKRSLAEALISRCIDPSKPDRRSERQSYGRQEGRGGGKGQGWRAALRSDAVLGERWETGISFQIQEKILTRFGRWRNECRSSTHRWNTHIDFWRWAWTNICNENDKEKSMNLSQKV